MRAAVAAAFVAFAFAAAVAAVTVAAAAAAAAAVVAAQVEGGGLRSQCAGHRPQLLVVHCMGPNPMRRAIARMFLWVISGKLQLLVQEEDLDL